jgi:hypothetical protein
LTGSVCITMYNSEVLGVLKEEDMPIIHTNFKKLNIS